MQNSSLRVDQIKSKRNGFVVERILQFREGARTSRPNEHQKVGRPQSVTIDPVDQRVGGGLLEERARRDEHLRFCRSAERCDHDPARLNNGNPAFLVETTRQREEDTIFLLLLVQLPLHLASVPNRLLHPLTQRIQIKLFSGGSLLLSNQSRSPFLLALLLTTQVREGTFAPDSFGFGFEPRGAG